MRKYTEQTFIEAVASSTSIRQVLNKLQLAQAGGNYQSAKNHIENLGLDTSHFIGQGWSKGRTLQPKRPIQDYLSNKHGTSSHALRLRLIKEGYFKPSCNKCGLDKWLGKPIPLELEHKDGNHKNNQLTNLELLCPNCHALTPTYRGKNAKHKHK